MPSNTRQVIDPKDILCNMCGGSMCPIETMNEQYPHGLFEAKVTGGYNSYHLLDMSCYTFSFCEGCLRKMFNQCKIKPNVNDVKFNSSLELVDGEQTSWEEDVASYEYRVWKDDGGHHQAYLNRRCNAIKDCPNQAVFTLLHDHTEFTEEALCEHHKDRKYLNSTLVKFIPDVLKSFL